MRKAIMAGLAFLWLAPPASAQVTQSREQILFYTQQWSGERFADGRPKLSDDLLLRALDCTIEDLWDFLGSHGYRNQFESGWQGLHIDKPFAGRAMTTQYMPSRPDMAAAMAAEGTKEGRDNLSSNGWPIAMLQKGDMWVVDGYGKITEGTIVGSNLGNAVAAKGANFVYDAGIRDEEELKEIPNFNGFYRGQDPSAWAQMQLVSVNAPIHIGRATVLPGDLVLAKPQGVIVIPAFLAEDAVSSAEFTGLMDAYNFELNKTGANGTTFEGGWNAAKYAALGQWVGAHPERLKMSRAEFDKLLAQRTKPRS
jgi:4-hydroxy-4-methyl-2-oxoglutarate aldolase